MKFSEGGAFKIHAAQVLCSGFGFPARSFCPPAHGLNALNKGGKSADIVFNIKKCEQKIILQSNNKFLHFDMLIL